MMILGVCTCVQCFLTFKDWGNWGDQSVLFVLANCANVIGRFSLISLYILWENIYLKKSMHMYKKETHGKFNALKQISFIELQTCSMYI
jgi:hypothetical protein